MAGLVALAGLVLLASCAPDAPSALSAHRSTTPSTSATRPTTPPSRRTATARLTRVVARVAFRDDSHGYGLFWTADPVSLSCRMSVAPTDDGGTTFGPATPVGPTTQRCADGGLSFDDAGDGFVFGPGLWVTHDGGRSWSDAHLAGTVLSVVAVGLSVWMLQAACGPDPSSSCMLTLTQSTDGGRTWSGAPTDVSPSPIPDTFGSTAGDDQTSMVRSNPTSAQIFVPPLWFSTSDAGQTWQQHTVRCGAGL